MGSYENRPYFIVSEDNESLAVAADPASGQVTLVADPGDLRPDAMWVFEPLPGAESLYRVWLYASSGGLYLTASGDSAGSAVVVAPAEPGADTQFWLVDDGVWYASGRRDLVLGFPGDVPVPGIFLDLAEAPDRHTLPDKFAPKPVTFEF